MKKNVKMKTEVFGLKRGKLKKRLTHDPRSTAHPREDDTAKRKSLKEFVSSFMISVRERLVKEAKKGIETDENLAALLPFGRPA